MIVAGVMSGTSADGINVALVRIGERGRGRPRHTNLYTLLAHGEYPYPAPVRRAILSMMNAESARVADLARLNFLLGELYADAIADTIRKHRVKLDLVGCHGQTLYHQGTAQPFLGRKLAVTWQTGEGAVIAARLGVPVVSDFRPADMAAGGKGAPLVPFLDYALYRDPRIGRIAQNIGGIANLTAIPLNAKPEQVIAFDTGPGNMVMDAMTEKLFAKRYDRDGRIAASGRVLDEVVAHFMKASFFRQAPPKTAGREEFGAGFAKSFLRRCGRTDKRDVVATATAFTAHSIADAVQRFVLLKRERFQEMVVSGGGAKNPSLMAMLRNELVPLGIALRFSDEFGVPTEAKEAVAFAVMAYETWHRRPSNVPSATGAKRPAILGKISYA
ncbi:MAG TPA: anhydro-N-acetylmuramic acid kinase [Terriglobales bacterium]|nr:anhydro-N-acetylmuramic acid kinase [Terriglobales bacterium]